MDTMQQEALRRAQEMHSRVTHSAPSGGTHNNSHKESKLTLTEDKSSNKDLEKTSASPPANPSSALENLFEDKEKLLILLLIMILSAEENTDPVLILALLYIII